MKHLFAFLAAALLTVCSSGTAQAARWDADDTAARIDAVTRVYASFAVNLMDLSTVDHDLVRMDRIAAGFAAQAVHSMVQGRSRLLEAYIVAARHILRVRSGLHGSALAHYTDRADAIAKTFLN